MFCQFPRFDSPKVVFKKALHRKLSRAGFHELDQRALVRSLLRPPPLVLQGFPHDPGRFSVGSFDVSTYSFFLVGLVHALIHGGNFVQSDVSVQPSTTARQALTSQFFFI